jgi:hypothetical protein
VDGLPAASTAVTVTWVVPTGKRLPEAGLEVTVGEAVTASVAVAAGRVTVALLALVACAVTGAGQVSVGGVVSRTTTLKVQVDWLPEVSVALAVTWWVPREKVLPEAWL